MSGVIPAVLAPPRLPTMKALELRAYDGISLVFVSNKPVPVPAHGEVLVRVQSAPITVHDVLFLQGRYGANRQLPVVPGLECSGVVVQSGGGLLALIRLHQADDPSGLGHAPPKKKRRPG